MSKFFVSNNQINNDIVVIEGQDYNHIKNVLRYKVDDCLTICDSSNGINYYCEIKSFDNNSVVCKIISTLDNDTESNV